jgi:hypothetical protein
MALQLFDEIADLMQLAGDADALRTMGLTLVAADAVVWLPLPGDDTVEAHKILPAVLAILRVTHGIRQ